MQKPEQTMTARRALVTWILMIPIAIANGTLRQFGYAAWMGEPAAHQLSCITAILAFGLLVFATTRRWHFRSYEQAWIVGLLWAAATIGFETALGRSRGMSWRAVFADYAVWMGQLWALVVCFIALSPVLSLIWDRASESGGASHAR